MSHQRQDSGSPARSSIEVKGNSDSEDYESDAQRDEAMDSSMAEESRIEVRSTLAYDEDKGKPRPGDEDDVSGSPGDGGAAGARFRGVSRGPLGAVGVVDNRQILAAQAREVEDLIRSIEADDGQASMADDYTEWAGLNADLEKLIKDKQVLHEYVRKTTERVEIRQKEIQEWTSKLSTMADVESDKLVSNRDRLPPNLGPALMRLVTLYFQDDDSIDKMPDRYKELLGKDLNLLAQKALPPAPSQDVTVLRKELASARGDAEAARDAITERDSTIRELEAEKVRRDSVNASLQTTIKNLESRYNEAWVREDKRYNAMELEAKRYRSQYKESHEAQDRLTAMLVQEEEEKKRLQKRLDDARRLFKQKEEVIKQLNEDIKVFTAVEEGAKPALDVLKDSINLLREQKKAADEMHEKLVADMQDTAQSQQDRQQRKITQLEDDVTKLQRENARTRQLERERQSLQEQVKDLTGRNQTLSADVEARVRREGAMCEEKRALEEKNSELGVTIEKMQARLDELNTRNGKLQANEGLLSSRVEQLRQTIREKDSKRDDAVRDLRDNLDVWESKCEELRAENNVLKQDAQTAERAINNAQLQLNSHTQVTADLARHKKKVESLEKENEGVRKRLESSEEEKRRFETSLDASLSETETLRAESQQAQVKIDKLTDERTKDREKIRGLEDKVQNAELELTNQRTTVSGLDQQVKSKDGQVTKLLADVTRFGSNEEEYKKSLALEQGKVKNLEAQVSSAESSIETERLRTAQLTKDKQELSAASVAQRTEADEAYGALERSLEEEKTRIEQLRQANEDLTRSVSEQRREADEAQRELLVSVDKEKDKVRQLQGTVAELKDSVKSLQDEKVKAARDFGALEASLERETSELARLQVDADHTSFALDKLKETHEVQLKLAESQLKTHLDAREQLINQVRRHEAEAKRTETEMASLTSRLSEAGDLLVGAHNQARESVQGLQGFLSRLCLAPPTEPEIFSGLARQLQTPGTLETQEPARPAGWVILEAWGEGIGEEAIQLPEGLEMLVLELFRTAVVGDVGTRKCHRVLQQTIHAVSAGTVIHAGIFGEVAKVLFEAITARPDDGFEAGLILWQLLDLIQQRWDPAGLGTIRDGIAGSLKAHEYGRVFEVVAGRGQFHQCDECHFFSDTFAVLARAGQWRAALINTKDQSVRFFSKARWTHGLRGCTVKPVGDHSGVFLPSNSVQDMIWAHKMF